MDNTTPDSNEASQLDNIVLTTVDEIQTSAPLLGKDDGAAMTHTFDSMSENSAAVVTDADGNPIPPATTSTRTSGESKRPRSSLTWFIIALIAVLVIIVAVLIPTVFLKGSDSPSTTTDSSKLNDNMNVEPKPTTPTTSTGTAPISGSQPQAPPHTNSVPAPVPVVPGTATPTANTRTPLEDAVWTVLTSMLLDPTPLYNAWSLERHVYEWMVTPSSTSGSSSTNSRPTYLETLLVDSKGNVTAELDEYVATKVFQRYALALLDAIWHTTRPNSTTGKKGQRKLQQTLTLRSANKLLDECSWIGVTCSNWTYGFSNDTMQVATKLVWREMSLQGPIHEALLNLHHLTYLDVTGNQLTGSIPDFIYENMTDLTHLVLHKNELTGTISPKIESLQKLEKLFLSFNRLTGKIPLEIGGGTVKNSTRPLEYIMLANNSLSGPLPSPLNLKFLSHLDVGFNQLTGTIPEDWIVGSASLTKLRALSLDHNKLTGTMPGTLPRLGNGKMEEIHLNDNHFSGSYSFDAPYASKTFMNVLEIQHNNFTAIATSICGLSVLDGEGELIELGADCDACTCRTFCDICY